MRSLLLALLFPALLPSLAHANIEMQGGGWPEGMASSFVGIINSASLIIDKQTFSNSARLTITPLKKGDNRVFIVDFYDSNLIEGLSYNSAVGKKIRVSLDNPQRPILVIIQD